MVHENDTKVLVHFQTPSYTYKALQAVVANDRPSDDQLISIIIINLSEKPVQLSNNPWSLCDFADDLQLDQNGGNQE